jgi:hypothetical protein
MVQRHRQFDDAQPRSEVTTCNRDRIDGFAAQFIGDLPEIPIVMTILPPVSGMRVSIPQWRS